MPGSTLNGSRTCSHRATSRRSSRGSADGMARMISWARVRSAIDGRSSDVPSTSHPWIRSPRFVGSSSRMPTSSYPVGKRRISRARTLPASPAPTIMTRVLRRSPFSSQRACRSRSNPVRYATQRAPVSCVVSTHSMSSTDRGIVTTPSSSQRRPRKTIVPADVATSNRSTSFVEMNRQRPVERRNTLAKTRRTAATAGTVRRKPSNHWPNAPNSKRSKKPPR
jgi:hypothetical protein